MAAGCCFFLFTGVTLMLTYSIFLLLLAEYTPRSESTPHLSMYLFIHSIYLPIYFFNYLIMGLFSYLPICI